MKNVDVSKLLELVQKADILERSLMLGEDLVLIKYGKDGSIVSKTHYNYTPGSLAIIDARLEKTAKKRRKKWESRYLEFASLLPQLDWVMIPEDYGVRIVEAEGQGTEDEFTIAFLGYNEIELQHLSVLVADALLEDFEDKLAEEAEKKREAENPANSSASKTVANPANAGSETKDADTADSADSADDDLEPIAISEAIEDFAKRFGLNATSLQELAKDKGIIIIGVAP